MQVFPMLLALLKAVPAIKDLFDRFMVWYTEREIASMRKDNALALIKVVKEHDQRELEKAIGNILPGKPSGDAGARIVPNRPPNVH